MEIGSKSEETDVIQMKIMDASSYHFETVLP